MLHCGTSNLTIENGALSRFFLRRKSAANFEAWSITARGNKFFHTFKKDYRIKSRALFENAIKLDPGYVDAWLLLAATHERDEADVRGSKESRAASLKRALELVQKALTMDDKNALSHLQREMIYRTQRQFENAISMDPAFVFGGQPYLLEGGKESDYHCVQDYMQDVRIWI